MIKEIDLTIPNKMWQHPWQLVHRVALHDKLKAVATAKDAPGTPANLYTSSKVANVDPDAGTLAFADGSTRTADLIIGADGIYVCIPQIHPFVRPSESANGRISRKLARRLAGQRPSCLVPGRRPSASFFNARSHSTTP